MDTIRKNIGIIPARGGSKRIPRKNIRPISGRPLIQWAIEIALSSGVFDQVIVSTDDEEIADASISAGAGVPFVRPANLSDDFTPTVPVISHAIGELRSRGSFYDSVCCIYPASIFVESTDYANSLELLLGSPSRQYVATIAAYPHPIQRALTLSERSELDFVDPDFADVRTQDLPERWHDAGQFYWGRTEAWLRNVPILANATGYPLDASQVQDIDTDEDWRRAELLHRLLVGPAQPSE